jgi:hypothetical protein
LDFKGLFGIPTVSNHKSLCNKVKVLVKVKFTLEQATKAQRGEKRYSSTLSLTSALDGGGWSTPWPGCFTPGKDLIPIV